MQKIRTGVRQNTHKKVDEAMTAFSTMEKETKVAFSTMGKETKAAIAAVEKKLDDQQKNMQEALLNMNSKLEQLLRNRTEIGSELVATNVRVRVSTDSSESAILDRAVSAVISTHRRVPLKTVSTVDCSCFELNRDIACTQLVHSI